MVKAISGAQRTKLLRRLEEPLAVMHEELKRRDEVALVELTKVENETETAILAATSGFEERIAAKIKKLNRSAPKRAPRAPLAPGHRRFIHA